MTASSARVSTAAVALVAVLTTGCEPLFTDAPPGASSQEAATAAPTPSALTTVAPEQLRRESPETPSATGSPTTEPRGSSPAPVERGLSQQQVSAMTQARATVSGRDVMEQLASSAERIAQRMAEGEPTAAPTPSNLDPGSNRGLGYQLMLEFGFARDQWPALNRLWQRESGWHHLAQNPSSGAYGIPQSLPAEKMAVVGDDWRTNPATQIRWGLAYIAERYGTPDRAWAHSQRVGWY